MYLERGGELLGWNESEGVIYYMDERMEEEGKSLEVA